VGSCSCLEVSGDAAVCSLASGSSPVAASHGRSMGCASVHENGPLRVDSPHPLAPAPSLLFVALRSEERLFLRGRPSRSKARLTLAVETLMP
jgi:hypothetical protein